MLENCIIYLLEIVKYYLIMKNLLGFELRKNYLLQIIGGIGIIVFSAVATFFRYNLFPFFLCYVLIETFIMFKGKFWSVVSSICWLILIVSMFDELFFVITQILMYKVDCGDKLESIIATIVSVLFIKIMIDILRKKAKNEQICFSRAYYLYFSILTLSEGVLVSILKRYVEDEEGLKALGLVGICTLIMIVNIVIVLLLAVSNDGYKQRDELNKKYMKIQAEHYMYLEQKNRDVRSFRHDIVGHIITIKELNASGKNDEIHHYLEKIQEKVHTNDKQAILKNSIADAIVSHVIYEAEGLGVHMEVEGEWSQECVMEPYDICVILANLLNNAIEAASDSDEKYVKVIINSDINGMEIFVENSYSGVIKNEGEVLITTKNDRINHGYGLFNVRESLKKYGGSISINVAINKYYSNTFIPILIKK